MKGGGGYDQMTAKDGKGRNVSQKSRVCVTVCFF